MSKFIDLTGKKFNMLTVLELHDKENGIARWKCQCECGNISIVRGGNLKSGAVKSCGCMSSRVRKKTHCESNTKLYRHWISMIYRCSNPKHFAYKWYGARGIKVCDEWKTYEGFKEWVLKTKPKDYEDISVERVDVNGDYCPQNCIWIPLREQANNRRTCRYYTYNGKTQNLMQWCKEYNVNYKLVHDRIYKSGWSFEKAMFTPKIDNRTKKPITEVKNGRVFE